mmetsp:Transcript_20730/g.46032  ORF Transcript_20730/g.46032 Transcript_20730/m.46032 type:complete len:584 (-) Transcript_20730:831-2582(-)
MNEEESESKMEETASSNATVPLLDDHGLEAQSKITRKTVRPRPEEVNASLKGLRWIIFPDNRLAQVWDMVMIMAIWFYAFALPFQIGISGGYFIVYFRSYFAFQVVVNSIFFFDVWLTFFRAFKDKDGKLVYSLKSIRRAYFRSGWFFVNILACTPTTIIMYANGQRLINNVGMDALADHNFRLSMLLNLFKLFRLARINRVMKQSELINSMWERARIEVALCLKFSFTIVLVAHWIACMWGIIAYQSSQSFGDEMGDTLNWISNWKNSSYVEGGLDPIGWSNAMDRYWLCLFWSIQSITSIGYGNIVPVTSEEYAFANFLMLLCGVFWAYIIGNLVEVVTSMSSKQRAYFARMGEANAMVRDFTTMELPAEVSGTTHTRTSKRVRRFITNQRDLSTLEGGREDGQNACALNEAYPTLDVLSPDLKRICALHLTHDMLETVPYLSSKFLSSNEQAELGLKCFSMEFAKGDRFKAHPELGRGCLIFTRGMAVSTRGEASTFAFRQDLKGRPINANEVLVEDGCHEKYQMTFEFTGFSKVLFVPRTAILETLARNRRAWADCGRWKYLSAAVILMSCEERANAPT